MRGSDSVEFVRLLRDCVLAVEGLVFVGFTWIPKLRQFLPSFLPLQAELQLLDHYFMLFDDFDVIFLQGLRS